MIIKFFFKKKKFPNISIKSKAQLRATKINKHKFALKKTWFFFKTIKQERNIFWIESIKSWETQKEKLEKAELFAFDTETTSLDYNKARIVGVSFALTPGKAAYVPLAHDYAGVPDQLDRSEVLEKLRPLLENPHQPKLGQNLKYDMHVLANHGIALRGIAHDTMLESYVLNSTATKHNMEDLAKI